MVELLDQIEAMLVQECTAYRTVDYLAPSFQQSISYRSLEAELCEQMEHSSSTSPPMTPSFPPQGGAQGTSVCGSDSSSNSNGSGITELWREKICEWCYQVIDHFDFSREVVAIAMNYLDRYLSTKIVHKKVFQLAAMTALFLAVKLHEPSKLSMASMIELSRGCFTVPQMVAMELSLIRTLKWHLHPPSAHSFTKRFLHLVPLSNSTGTGIVSVDVLYDVLELSRFLAELAVIDYFFVLQRPSDVAVAAIANAMQDIPAVSMDAQCDFFSLLQERFNIDIRSSHSIMECRNRLRLLCALQGSMTGGGSAESGHLRGETSPVCVSYGTPIYQAPTKTNNNSAEETPSSPAA